MKTIGFIFSAGKEKRFLDNKPKALQNIFGETILEHNINILRKYCDDVFVVTNHNYEPMFAQYDHLTIESGNGCGDAVLKAMELCKDGYYNNVIIQWGDCYLYEDIIKESIGVNNLGYDIIIPCHYEKKPYVKFCYSNNSMKVEFSKYGETKGSEGYHDFGFFYGKFHKILSYLQEFANAHKCGKRYVHKHGNELQFLDVINETKIQAKLVFVDSLTPISFNTKEELDLINKI